MRTTAIRASIRATDGGWSPTCAFITWSVINHAPTLSGYDYYVEADVPLEGFDFLGRNRCSAASLKHPGKHGRAVFEVFPVCWMARATIDKRDIGGRAHCHFGRHLR